MPRRMNELRRFLKRYPDSKGFPRLTITEWIKAKRISLERAPKIPQEIKDVRAWVGREWKAYYNFLERAPDFVGNNFPKTTFKEWLQRQREIQTPKGKQLAVMKRINAWIEREWLSYQRFIKDYPDCTACSFPGLMFKEWMQRQRIETRKTAKR